MTGRVSPLTTGVVGALALSFPLFAVEYLRVGAGPLTLAAPVALSGVLIGLGVVRSSVDVTALRARIAPVSAAMATFTILFLAWHVLSALRAENFGWALREVVKLTTGMLCLAGVVWFLPPDRRLLERFWTLLIWASAALLTFLIYQYAIVFRVPYLGTVLDEPSRAARNQLTWYLVFVLPFAFAYVRAGAGHRWVRAIPFLVLVCGLIYAASRGAILSVTMGWLWMSFAGRGVHGLQRWAQGLGLLVRVAVLAFVALQLLGAIVGTERLEVGRRMLALANPDAVAESHSVDYRTSMAQAAWSSFTRSPIVGIGLTNTGTHEGLLTHNDYLALLADTGAIGLFLFLAILVTAAIWIRALPPRGSPDEDWWVTWGGRGALAAVVVSLLFINAYPNTIFWVVLGLARVARRAATVGAS